MSIEKIKGSIDGISGTGKFNLQANNNRAYLDYPKDSVCFTGAAAQTKTLKEILLGIMPKKIKNMVKIHEGMGEIQNQLINAIGTGLVAPLFIKYNPLSDTDKDTRTYTAWRQPVSAVLAVATQCAIVIPFNAAIKKGADIGFFPTQYNSSLFPSDDYLKHMIKANNPGKKFNKEEMKAEIENYKKQNDKALEKMISDDKIILNTSDGSKTTKLEMPQEDFKKLFMETLDNIIDAEEIEKRKAIDHKLPQKINRGIFFHNNPEESRAVVQRLSNKVSQIYTQADFGATPDKFVEASKDFDKECKKLISELKAENKKNPAKKKVNNELIKIVKEIKNKNTGSDASAMRVLELKLNNMLENIDTMASKKSTQEIIEYVNEVIYIRTNAIDGTIGTLSKIRSKLQTSGITVKEAQEIINNTITNAENLVKTKLRAKGLNEKEINESIEFTENVSIRLKQKAGSVAKCIGDQLKKHVKSNIDGLKRWTGLGVSLAILPATCWLLNKIYPWFMDLAFPKLSNKTAKPKQDNNNKNTEVK